MSRPKNLKRAERKLADAQKDALLASCLKAFEALPTAEHSRNCLRLLTGLVPTNGENPCHALAYFMAEQVRTFLDQGK
jgi:hypothetical protein